MVKSPCRDCKNRTLHCHSECFVYREYLQNLAHEKEVIKKATRAERQLNSIIMTTRNKPSTRFWGKSK